MFILDGLAALGEGGLITAGQDLAGQLTALHPGIRLGWRQLGAPPTASRRPRRYRRRAARSGGRVVISTAPL